MTPRPAFGPVRRVGAILLLGMMVALLAPSTSYAGARDLADRPQSAVVQQPTSVRPPLDERQRRRRADETKTPLQVELASISPATIPRKGPIRITGTVTNVSSEDWGSINVYPFVSHGPMTTRDQLDDALASDPAAVVGSRFYGPGLFAQIGDLGPGQSSPFTLVIPRRQLPINGAPGVYWLGAHALGANAEGMDSVADGRARTFINLVPKKTATAQVALALPVRANMQRTRDGRLAAEGRWAELVTAEGRLSRIEALVAQAPDQSANLIVDAAVVDAIGSLEAGNPPANLGTETKTESKVSADARRDAASWLSRLGTLSKRQRLHTVPYADPDIAALARWRPHLLSQAIDTAKASLQSRELTADPILAPLDGRFDPGLLEDVGTLPLLLSSGAAADDLDAADYDTVAGPHLIFADQAISAGGPAPTPPFDALAMRQLILAAGYLQVHQSSDPTDLTQTSTPPLVVSLPRLWDPGANWREADFFGGLRQPWLKLGGLPNANDDVYNDRLGYDDADEIPADNVRSAADVLRAARTMGELLAADNDAQAVFTSAALAATSYDARVHPLLTRNATEDAGRFIAGQLAKVQLAGNDFVTLSGGSGPVSVSIVNGMDSPITVGIRPVTASSKIKVSVPDEVTLGPGQRASVKVLIDTNTVGVQQIALVPVTSDGTRIGDPFTFNLRTSQVGKLIWFIMIAGGALLFVMIVRRVVRRIRNKTWKLDEKETSERVQH